MRKDEMLDKARELYLKSHGDLSPKEIAAKLGVSPEKVRRWKYRGKWEEELKKPRRGAPKGNHNAKGHGAPKGNANAETHGAYSRPRIERLSPEQREEIEQLEAKFHENAVRQLRRLEIKRADLENRIADLQDRPEDVADLLDRSMKMKLSDGKEAEYSFRSTAFSRRMTLEAELNRTDGRIQKLLDSIRNQESEQRRLDLDRERLEFNKQKAAGIFNFDENGTVIPDDDGEEIVEA